MCLRIILYIIKYILLQIYFTVKVKVANFKILKLHRNRK